MIIEPSLRLQGLSSYPFKEINDAVTQLKESGVTPIDFGVGDPSEPTPDFVQSVLPGAAKKHSCTGYPSYIGGLEYRQACADYFQRRFGVSLDPLSEISSTIGSKEAVFHFPQGLVNPGETVIIPSPGYPPMKTGTVFAGGVPYFVPLLEKHDFLIDYASIPDDVAEKAKVIWLNYPNSPTGAVATREFYEGIVEWAHRHNIVIASDEGCYIDIYFEKQPLSILEVAKEGVITFYSLSKRNNMTGYRVGFVAGDSAVIDVFKKLKTNIDSGTPSIIQEAAIAALHNDEHHLLMSDAYFAKGKILLNAFTALGLTVRQPQATFYIWQKVPEGMSDVDFAKRLLSPEIGIVVTPGSLISDVCSDGTHPGEGYVRFALMPSLDEVKLAAERLRGLKFA
jgi:LL-diaminopimelate aminotransferase